MRRLKAAVAIEGHGNEDQKLWRKLRISYDDLGDIEKALFLDFACILCDMGVVHMNTIIRIWGDRAGLQTLIDSLLIKVSSELLIQMRQKQDSFKLPYSIKCPVFP